MRLFFIVVLISFSYFAPGITVAKPLVVATTFSPDALHYVINEWQKQSGEEPIVMVNRTSAALENILQRNQGQGFDLVLSSSPFLMNRLNQLGLLASHHETLYEHNRLVPDFLRRTSVAVAVSGFGILTNQQRLATLHLAMPQDWADLAHADYQGLLLMSSPSRSDTNHLLVENLLQNRGWDSGWATLLSLSGNLMTIAPRSFNVVDKLNNDFGAIGITIDNYALRLSHQPHLHFQYFPHSIAVPTYVSILHASEQPKQAEKFVQFLLSRQGQAALTNAQTGKLPITESVSGQPLSQIQQRLLAQPSLDYSLVLAREKMVKSLFDYAITFRLFQLQDMWNALYRAEKRAKKPLASIRLLLTATPVTSQQSESPAYLNQWQSHQFVEEELIRWQLFFQQHQQDAMIELDKLK